MNSLYKMFLKRCLPLVIVALLANCAASGNAKKSQAEQAKIERLVTEKNFIATMDRALPTMTTSMNSILNSSLFPPGGATNQLSLIGNTNYFKVMGDSVAAYLPYFGERQMGGGYNNNDAGIEFKGVPKDMKMSKNEKTNGYDLRFSINNGMENFNVVLSLFPGLTTNLYITSSQRFAIRYSGSAKSIPEE